MHPLIRPLTEIKPLRDPILIAGFADNSGTTAAAAAAYLVELWGGKPLADFDPEELFDFTSRRPFARQEDGERIVDWPTSRIFVASPEGADRDVLILVGVEPHLRWRSFCEAVASIMRETGATESVTFGSYPAPTPHTRAVPVRLSASDLEFGRKFGMEPAPSAYEGPIGITGVLNVALGKEFRTASLSTMTPFYVGAEQNPHAIMTLVQLIDRGLGTSTPLSLLTEAAVALDHQAALAVQESQPLQAIVQSLEQQFDGLSISGPILIAPTDVETELPSSEDLIADLEQFLRAQDTGRNAA